MRLTGFLLNLGVPWKFYPFFSLLPTRSSLSSSSAQIIMLRNVAQRVIVTRPILVSRTIVPFIAIRRTLATESATTSTSSDATPIPPSSAKSLDPKLNKLLDEISGLTLLETASLVDELKVCQILLLDCRMTSAYTCALASSRAPLIQRSLSWPAHSLTTLMPIFL